MYGERSSRDFSRLPQIEILLAGHVWTEAESQGPEEMCLSLEHQNPAKTAEKMGYFDRVTFSLHILYITY